jgi:hypothetical protein
MDKMDNIDKIEFIDIISQLCLGDLIILEQILNYRNQADQIRCRKELRHKICHYPELYNAYCAAQVVDNPIDHIKTQIISRL